MSPEKTRFSARVRTETLETLDDYAERERVNRSQAIDRMVDEWQQLREKEEESSNTSAGGGGRGVPLIGRLRALRPIDVYLLVAVTAILYFTDPTFALASVALAAGAALVYWATHYVGFHQAQTAKGIGRLVGEWPPNDGEQTEEEEVAEDA